MSKGKRILISSLVFLLYALCIILSFSFIGKNGNNLSINANGIDYVFSLDIDQIISVPGVLGDTVFEIKDKKARIISSPCQNKTCIAQGWTNTLICLPNRVIATLEDKKEEVDAIAR